MSEEILQIAATIEEVKTRKDRTLKITLGSQELNPDQSALMMKMAHNLGWFFFKENELSKEDVDVKESAPNFKGEKTPQQRLRAVIFVWWEQAGKPGKDFELFYRNKIEAFIDWVKDKLEPKDNEE